MRFELKLVDIQLKNFRLFEEVKVNFDDKLTVLIGENGAGKTALLEGVAKALNAVVLRLRKNTTELDEHKYYALTDVKYGQDAILTDMNLQQIFEDDENEQSKKRAKELLEIENEYQERFNELNDTLKNSLENDYEFWENEIALFERDIDEKRKNVEEQYGKQVEPNNIKYRLNPTYREDIQKEPFDEENIEIIERVALEIDKARKGKKEINLPVIVYYPCERIITDSKNGKDETYGMNLFNGYDHALDGLSLDYKRFLEWYDWQERIERVKKSNKVLEIVKQAILAILNDDDDETFKNIYIDPSQFKNPRLIMQKGTDEVEINQLSSGEKSLMMLVSNLAYRLALLNPFSKDPLKEGQGIVLIDEIDLHLHPRWQRVVIPKLQNIFPRIQWVITTHSPQVLMNVKRENVQVINNGKIEEAPFIEGRDANALSTDVFGLTKRLPEYEKMLDKIYDLIDKGEEKQAKIEIETLKQKWGEADLDLHRAETFLEML